MKNAPLLRENVLMGDIMKSILMLLLAAFSSASYASIYRCDYDLCTWSDGCTTYQEIFRIENNKISHWSELRFNKDKVDYTDIRNIDKDDISTGTIEAQRPASGNYHAVGEELVSKNDNKPHYNIMYKELEVYTSLMMGRPKGRVIETTHYHHAKNPNREIKPGVQTYRCNLVR